MTTVASRIALDITPLTGFTGAEIRGVDLHRTLAESTVADILTALASPRRVAHRRHLHGDPTHGLHPQCPDDARAGW
jgi:hypothetical protein